MARVRPSRARRDAVDTSAGLHQLRTSPCVPARTTKVSGRGVVDPHNLREAHTQKDYVTDNVGQNIEETAVALHPPAQRHRPNHRERSFTASAGGR